MANATGRPTAPLVLSSDERDYLEWQVRRRLASYCVCALPRGNHAGRLALLDALAMGGPPPSVARQARSIAPIIDRIDPAGSASLRTVARQVNGE